MNSLYDDIGTGLPDLQFYGFEKYHGALYVGKSTEKKNWNTLKLFANEFQCLPSPRQKNSSSLVAVVVIIWDWKKVAFFAFDCTKLLNKLFSCPKISFLNNPVWSFFPNCWHAFAGGIESFINAVSELSGHRWQKPKPTLYYLKWMRNKSLSLFHEKCCIEIYAYPTYNHIMCSLL